MKLDSQTTVLSDGTLSFTEGAEAQYLLKGLTITDEENNPFSITITLSDVNAGALSAVASGVAIVTIDGGILTISGPPADVNATLGSVLFMPETNFNGNASVSIVMRDEQGAESGDSHSNPGGGKCQ